MKFPTAASSPRPIRLSTQTREWAWQSMRGYYGDKAILNNCVSLDKYEDFPNMSQQQKYNAAIREIAASAPLTICDHEQICGSASLGLAKAATVPAVFQGKGVFSGVNHLTLRYDKVIRCGLNSYLDDINNRMKDASLDSAQLEFLNGLKNVIESIRIIHSRYLEATKTQKPQIYQLLKQVPFEPARNFKEAVQSLWFIFAFVRLCGNWPGIGRLDWLLGDYLKKDIADGVITKDEAREFLASLFIKGCEWIESNHPAGSGDAQYYQNIVLAGIDENGVEITNDVTYLTLDIIEETGISDFPVTVRLNSKTPKKLLKKVARVMRHGGGVIAVYNEELILRALKNEGYSEKESRNFANDGCWEVQIPGKTNFAYYPFDALKIFNRVIGIDREGDIPEFNGIDDIYAEFCKELNDEMTKLYDRTVTLPFSLGKNGWHCVYPIPLSSVIDLFEDDCIANARSYYDMGTSYTVKSPHIGGAPDVANSLYAIQKAVFEEKIVSFGDMVELLRKNWDENEVLRLRMRNKYVYYGNDSDESDYWEARILNDFADIVKNIGSKSDCPIKFIPGVSTFGRQIEWLPHRCATAFGYRKGDILSGNDSPTPGTDFEGATATIRSYCKANLEKQSCGSALDLKILPETLRGNDGIAALEGLIQGFLKLGGFFMQIDSVSAKTLRDAQQNPEAYKTLSVRVSGWNARFVTLNREWQKMVIERTEQNM